jgi:hypothetical protein
MNEYIVSEKELRELIEAANKYRALECGGVDNWEWFGYSLDDYLGDCAADLGITDQDTIEKFEFSDLTEIDLERFRRYEEHDADVDRRYTPGPRGIPLDKDRE